MHKQRQLNVLKACHEQSFVVLYSGTAPKKSNDQSYPFLVNRNFYYLTGIDQENVYLLMFKGMGKTLRILFVEPFDELKALWVGSGLSFDEAKEISQVDQVLSIHDFEAVLSRFLGDTRGAQFGHLKYLYLDFQRLSLDSLSSEEERLALKLQKNYPYLNLENIRHTLSRHRSIKDKIEVEKIKEALVITKEGIESLMKHSKPGMIEYELEAYYRFVLHSKGVGESFKTIAGAGKNATILHYEQNNTLINDNELILFDLGVSKDHYASDISRTFPVNGKFTDRQKAYYEIVLECNKKVIEYLKPGVTNEAWNNYAKELLTEGLMKLGKIKDPSELSKYYYHSIGHFLGLDVHDVGDYNEPFKEGQILTVEPGLYIADEGIGIRIEDNILLTKDGNINLSKDIIKEIKDIEEFMKK